MTPRAVEVLTLTLIDGKEYRFLLSAGGGRRLKERFKVETFNKFLEADVYEVGPPLLFEAMLDKPDQLTEEKFTDLLPGGIEYLTRAIFAVLGHSLPEPKDRPTSASEPTAQ